MLKGPGKKFEIAGVDCININSLRNNEEVKNLFSRKLDIIGISETKLDDSFPTNHNY